MRQSYSEFVERGRELAGRYGTAPGERDGAFRLKHPRAGSTVFFVLASDGSDWDESSLPGPVWEHVSVSTKSRCPTWEEMCWVKDLFFEPSECVVQFHPPHEHYVNDHDYCLHLWRLRDAEMPRPPPLCVGYGVKS